MNRITICTILIFTFFISNSQEFKSNLSLGLPVGEVSNIHSINFNLDFAYLWNINNKLKMGAIAGYSHFVGISSISDSGFLPLGATTRFNASNKSSLALDFGYAIGFSSGKSGGVFFAPKFYYDFNSTFDAFISYKSISVSNYDFSAMCLGLEFKL